MPRIASALVLAAAPCLGGSPGPENPNLAANAVTTASPESGTAAAAADGFVPEAGGRDDRGSVWTVSKDDLPTSLVFTWQTPATVSTVVYYGRTSWGFEVFKDYAIFIDDAPAPVAEGAFRNGHGPQPITLPAPVKARKLRLEFRSRHQAPGLPGNPGVAEVQIFAAPPTQADLLCRFTDLSLDFRYAYYPSHDLIRIHLPNPPADSADWHLALRPRHGTAVLAQRSGKLPIAAGGAALPVPDLPEGDYTLTLTLTGRGQPVIEERGIRRDRPEWEGNQLGREDVVIPPFTPLEVDPDRNVVRSVLRSHTHAAAGLWGQVVSRDHELLAAPVRLEATQGGKVHRAAGPPARIVEATPTRVRGEAPWAAGTLTGTTQFAYDYDGMKTITLELAPTATELDRLQLVIPLKANEAWLMHPVATTLRHHFAGRIPAVSHTTGATGTVWDSSAVRDRIDGIFVPYIYLGGPERGLCFAADNDRDWITDKATPMMVIDREGDTVLLRLNLVAKPAKLDRPRRLTFALQATPAKPMPEEPYNWRRWWATNTDPGTEDVQINLWGGNMYWGGRHFATSVYPFGKDFSHWDKLAEQRRTGVIDKEYEERWFARLDSLTEQQRREIEPGMRAGFQWSSGSPPNGPQTTKYRYVIPYTNPRGAQHETLEFLTTYLDEWVHGDIVDPLWPRMAGGDRPLRAAPGHPGGCVWYQVEPVPSRNDMLLFYHRKMLETFADGIYWDNWFLRPCYTPAEAGGPGYVDDDGRPRAGVNLMGFRALVRRTATMMHVMGKRPLTYIHMTNANIVPMLSFGTVNLDWEWRDQGHFKDLDMQDRQGPDLILAQSLGLQSGNLPVAITGGLLHGRDWLTRTLMATCFPHEIRIHGGSGDVAFAQIQMAQFGYGRPDCRVFRFWEDGFPLKTEGASMRALVLARDGKALIALGNFGSALATEPPAAESPAAAPTLAEYDAVQRAHKPSQETPSEAAHSPPTAASYKVRLRLDLEALGLSEAVRARDLEAMWFRRRARSPHAGDPPVAIRQPERIAPGVFEFEIVHHDFALLYVSPPSPAVDIRTAEDGSYRVTGKTYSAVIAADGTFASLVIGGTEFWQTDESARSGRFPGDEPGVVSLEGSTITARNEAVSVEYEFDESGIDVTNVGGLVQYRLSPNVTTGIGPRGTQDLKGAGGVHAIFAGRAGFSINPGLHKHESRLFPYPDPDRKGGFRYRLECGIPALPADAAAEPAEPEASKKP